MLPASMASVLPVSASFVASSSRIGSGSAERRILRQAPTEEFMSTVLLDEFHLRLFVPRRLSAAEVRAIRRVLNSKKFNAVLTSTVQSLVSRYRSLAKVGVRIEA